MTPESMRKRIENAKKNVKMAEEAVERRHKRLARLHSRYVKGKITDNEMRMLAELNTKNLPGEKFLRKLYIEELVSYEERLEGARGILKKYEDRATLLEKNILY